MNRLALLVVPLLTFAAPAVCADLGPYPQRDDYVDSPAPPRVVERERIIERHYYEPRYAERRVYVDPRVYYAPRVYSEAYYPRPYVYAYEAWRPRHYFPRGPFWHHRHHIW